MLLSTCSLASVGWKSSSFLCAQAQQSEQHLACGRADAYCSCAVICMQHGPDRGQWPVSRTSEVSLSFCMPQSRCMRGAPLSSRPESQTLCVLQHTLKCVQEGHCKPGEVLFGTDSHTCNAGAFGQFATGIGNTDAGFILGTGKLLIKVGACTQRGGLGSQGSCTSQALARSHTAVRRVAQSLGSQGSCTSQAISQHFAPRPPQARHFHRAVPCFWQAADGDGCPVAHGQLHRPDTAL